MAYLRGGDRKWLRPEEWVRVGVLSRKWATSRAKCCKRIVKARWYREKASQEYYTDVAWTLLATAVESLVGTWNSDGEPATNKMGRGKRFRLGLAKLADNCQLALSDDEAGEYWKRRSEFTHGADVAPPSNNAESDELYHKLECVVSQALAQTVDSNEYAANFSDESAVQRWLS